MKIRIKLGRWNNSWDGKRNLRRLWLFGYIWTPFVMIERPKEARNDASN